MARRTDAKRHAEVVMGALESLRRRGVIGVNMVDVAADLGMTRSALYWYVKGLPDLFEQALELILDQQSQAVSALVLAAEHPLDRIAAWMRATVAFYRDDPALLLALLQLWASARPHEPDKTLALFRARFEPLRAAAAALLRDGIASGEVAPCDPEAVVGVCAAVVDGALVHAISQGSDPVPLVEAAIATVLTPLRASAAGAQRPTAVPEAPPAEVPPATPPFLDGAVGIATQSVEVSGRRRQRDGWMAWD